MPWVLSRDNNIQNNKGTYFDETNELICNLSVCCLIMASRFQSISTGRTPQTIIYFLIVRDSVIAGTSAYCQRHVRLF